MKHQSATRLVMVLAFTAALIAFTAFRQDLSQTQQKSTFQKDYREYEDTTTPRKRNTPAITELDDKIEKAMKQVEKQMRQLEEQIKKMNLSTMQHELDASLSKIDFDKIGREIDVAVSKVERSNLEKQVKESMKQMKMLDTARLKATIDIAALRSDVGGFKIGETVEVAIQQAKAGFAEADKSLEKAKADLKLMEEFTSELEKEGLIDRKNGYRIEVKNNEIYLNGKKQPKEINEKYKKYFKKEDYSIINDGKDKIRI